MGNQIKFTPKNEKAVTGEDSGLEMENIQLKNTNRKLISKLDQQKQLIKKLTHELDTIRKSKELNDANSLKSQYQTLKSKNENLETLLLQSKKEVSKLKDEIKKLDKDSKGNSRWEKLKSIRK